MATKIEKFSKQWYLDNANMIVKVGNLSVTVTQHRTESRGGSWERGFRFYSTKWAMLKSTKGYSMDHGKTWHANARAAMKATKGKMKLDSDNHGEFAFDSIQKINQKYEPGFVWQR